MTGIELLFNTLDYGRQTLTDASWLTLATLLLFMTSIFMLLKVQWVLVAPFKGEPGTKPVSPIIKGRNALKSFAKALPGITALILIFLFIRWLAMVNLSYKRTTWQSDYFIGFMVTLFFFILLLFYEMQLVVWRRTVTWKVVNAMFKLVFVIFMGLLLAPYYILVTANEESFWNGGYFTFGLCIFTFYCFVCLYSFKGSPLSTLIPMVVLWGADVSYYTNMYAMQYGALGNGSAFVVMLFGFCGISIFRAVQNKQQVASPQFMLAYCIFLFILIVGIWFSLWGYYGYDFLGTHHEGFHQSSFYPD